MPRALGPQNGLRVVSRWPSKQTKNIRAFVFYVFWVVSRGTRKRLLRFPFPFFHGNQFRGSASTRLDVDSGLTMPRASQAWTPSDSLTRSCASHCRLRSGSLPLVQHEILTQKPGKAFFRFLGHTQRHVYQCPVILRCIPALGLRMLQDEKKAIRHFSFLSP